MLILCSICSDLVNQTESLYVTKCGHIFHHHCLAKWTARSQSCPQCRNKVTDRCMFRLYPTISNDTTVDDATTLQSKLDDAQMQLREQKMVCLEKDIELTTTDAELKRKEKLLKLCEKQIVVRDSAVAALKEQLEYLKIQNKETERLKEENESLKKNIQTLNGLQKILNATCDEVEMMMQGYSDIRTVATFATALKRALCESESKKTESRYNLQTLKQQLAAEKSKVASLEAKIRTVEDKLQEMLREELEALGSERPRSCPGCCGCALPRPGSPQPGGSGAQPGGAGAQPGGAGDTSLATLVESIESSESPYLQLKQSNLALAALQQRHPAPQTSGTSTLNTGKRPIFKASDKTASNAQKHSIFNKKETIFIDLDKYEQASESDESYNGLGGHSKKDSVPIPQTKIKPLVPRVSARHKLKRPNTAGSQDVGKMLKKAKGDNA